MSDDSTALELHLQSLEIARSDTDRARALWGAAVAAADLEIDDADDYLEAFRAISPDDPDTRLRAAVGLMINAERRGTLDGVFPVVSSLLPLAEYSTDPMVKGSFLVQLSYVETLRAYYTHARELAQRAEDVCRSVQSAFGEGTCYIALANAEIGLRRFSQAKQALRRVRNTAARLRDPYLAAATVSLPIKLALSEGSPQPRTIEPPEVESAPRSIRGELLALQALSAAIDGRSSDAAEAAVGARAMTSGIEASHLSRYADLIVRLREEETGALTDSIRELYRETVDADVYDALVLAYRSYPALLNELATTLDDLTDLRALLARAGDGHMAREAGIELGPTRTHPQARFGSLTHRESEILGLICAGLSNREIARHLVIAESTAKVHVHNVLKKLGVRNRLQAALMAQDWWCDPLDGLD
jgi:ATP/maltotriose-dependent transcriptional regulator MalT